MTFVGERIATGMAKRIIAGKADPGPRQGEWGDGPGVLGLTVRGVCETHAVRFLNAVHQHALNGGCGISATIAKQPMRRSG
jgi:hypothetical protein